MKRKWILIAIIIIASVLALSLGHSTSTSVIDVPRPSERTLDDFTFVTQDTSYADIEARLGKPDKDIGSGIHIFVYELNDGGEVWFGFADLNQMIYAKYQTATGEEVDLLTL